MTDAGGERLMVPFTDGIRFLVQRSPHGGCFMRVTC